MARSRLTRKGQVTIPAEVREHLALKSGDAVEFVVLENGTVMVKPAYLDVMDLEGFLARKGKKRLSIAQMSQIIRSKAGQTP